MAAPTVVGVAHTDVSVDATSINVDLPDGSNVVGRTVMIALVKDVATSPTWPSGWTVLDDAQVNVNSAWSCLRSRVIDGSEGFDGTGDTINVSSGLAEAWGAYSWLLDDAGVPEVAAANGGSGAPDPPNLAPSGGSQEYLWIVHSHFNDGYSGSVTGYPFADNQAADITGNVAHSRCSQIITASSQDPAAFSGGTGTWRVYTIAVPGISPPPDPTPYFISPARVI